MGSRGVYITIDITKNITINITKNKGNGMTIKKLILSLLFLY